MNTESFLGEHKKKNTKRRTLTLNLSWPALSQPISGHFCTLESQKCVHHKASVKKVGPTLPGFGKKKAERRKYGGSDLGNRSHCMTHGGGGNPLVPGGFCWCPASYFSAQLYPFSIPSYLELRGGGSAYAWRGLCGIPVQLWGHDSDGDMGNGRSWISQT